MPRRPKRPSYAFHKASGQAYARLNGRIIYLGKHGSPESKHRYDEVVAEWLTGSFERSSCSDRFRTGNLDRSQRRSTHRSGRNCLHGCQRFLSSDIRRTSHSLLPKSRLESRNGRATDKADDVGRRASSRSTDQPTSQQPGQPCDGRSDRTIRASPQRHLHKIRGRHLHQLPKGLSETHSRNGSDGSTPPQGSWLPDERTENAHSEAASTAESDRTGRQRSSQRPSPHPPQATSHRTPPQHRTTRDDDARATQWLEGLARDGRKAARQ